MVERGQVDDSFFDDIISDALSDAWGQQLAIYEDINTFDFDVIYSLIDQAQDEIQNKDNDEQTEDNIEDILDQADEQKRDQYSATGDFDEKREIDKIMDRPIK